MNVTDLREAIELHNDTYLRTDSVKIQDHALASLRTCSAARDSILAFLTAPLHHTIGNGRGGMAPAPE